MDAQQRGLERGPRSDSARLEISPRPGIDRFVLRWVIIADPVDADDHVPVPAYLERGRESRVPNNLIPAVRIALIYGLAESVVPRLDQNQQFSLHCFQDR